MPKRIVNERMVLVSLHMPKGLLDELDELVRKGIFPSRSEAIRIAVRELVEKEAQRQNLRKEFIIIPGR